MSAYAIWRSEYLSPSERGLLLQKEWSNGRDRSVLEEYRLMPRLRGIAHSAMRTNHDKSSKFAAQLFRD